MDKHRGWAQFRLFATVAVTVILMMGCAGTNPGGQAQNRSKGAGPKPVAAKPVPVAVARVTIGESASYYTTTATLQAEHHAQIMGRTTGVARKLLVEEGDLVEKDQVLLHIEDDDLKLKVKQAQINLSQLKSEHQRRIKMWESGVLAPREFEESENTVEKAEAELEVTRLNLSYAEVRAPFNGRIVRRHLDLGAQVQPGKLLFEIMDVKPLLVRIYIPANRMGNLNLGQRLGFKLDSTGETLTGTVRLISPIVDPQTGTVKVTAEIDEYPPDTRPGDFVEVAVVVDRREDAMLVPSVAVFEDQGRQVVFVTQHNKALRRPVRVGFVESGLTEIRDGIEVDDLIVVKGQRDLRDQMPLEIIEGPPGLAASESLDPVREANL